MLSSWFLQNWGTEGLPLLRKQPGQCYEGAEPTGAMVGADGDTPDVEIVPICGRADAAVVAEGVPYTGLPQVLAGNGVESAGAADRVAEVCRGGVEFIRYALRGLQDFAPLLGRREAREYGVGNRVRADGHAGRLHVADHRPVHPQVCANLWRAATRACRPSKVVNVAGRIRGRHSLVQLQQSADRRLAVGCIQRYRCGRPSGKLQHGSIALADHPGDLVPPWQHAFIDKARGNEECCWDSHRLEDWERDVVVVAVPVVERDHDVAAAPRLCHFRQIGRCYDVEVRFTEAQLLFEAWRIRTPEPTVQHRATAIADAVVV